jgi:hypothetical protein
VEKTFGAEEAVTYFGDKYPHLRQEMAEERVEKEYEVEEELRRMDSNELRIELEKEQKDRGYKPDPARYFPALDKEPTSKKGEPSPKSPTKVARQLVNPYATKVPAVTKSTEAQNRTIRTQFDLLEDVKTGRTKINSPSPRNEKLSQKNIK